MFTSKIDLAWAAGLFEGEGTFGNGNKKSLATSITSTDKDVLEHFQKIVGLGNINGPLKTKKPHWKPCYTWSCGGGEKPQALAVMLWKWLGPRRRAQIHKALLIWRGTAPRSIGNTCKLGHPLVFVSSNGKRPMKRGCRSCENARQRRRYRKTHPVKRITKYGVNG